MEGSSKDVIESIDVRSSPATEVDAEVLKVGVGVTGDVIKGEAGGAEESLSMGSEALELLECLKIKFEAAHMFC